MGVDEEFNEKIDTWIKDILQNPRNLASETELHEQGSLALKYFKEYDLDHSNSLTFNELKLLCEHLGLPMERDEEEALLKLDQDGNGTLDLFEFISWWLKRISTLPNPMKQQEAIAKYTFSKYDEDHSGFLDHTELGNLIEALGGNFTEDEIRQAVREIDCDNSGVIESSEFVVWWTNRAINSRESCSLISIKLKKLAAKANQVFSTDIFTAGWKGDKELIYNFLESEKRLLQASDEADFGEGWTLWHYLSYRGYVELMHQLFETFGSAINVNVLNNDGFTPLFYASQQGHLSLVELLLDHGADPTIFGRSQVTSTADGVEEQSLYEFMSPVEFVQDYPKLRSIFTRHPKCVKPKSLSRLDYQINFSCTNLNMYYLSFIVMVPLKSISSLPIRGWKLYLRWENSGILINRETSTSFLKNQRRFLQELAAPLLDVITIPVSAADPIQTNAYNSTTINNILIPQSFMQRLNLICLCIFLDDLELEVLVPPSTNLTLDQTIIYFLQYFSEIFTHILGQIFVLISTLTKRSVQSLLAVKLEDLFFTTLSRLVKHPSIDSNEQQRKGFEEAFLLLKTLVSEKKRLILKTKESKSECSDRAEGDSLNLNQLKECIADYWPKEANTLPKNSRTTGENGLKAVADGRKKRFQSDFFLVKDPSPIVEFSVQIISNNVLYESEPSESSKLSVNFNLLE
mmetsp:Transcript_5040/g.5513  ORF Transcript_5040/g.5513 Transcript_5040/m.5513 type:complete len:688 (+) Transcript_5040:53-2116(+)